MITEYGQEMNVSVTLSNENVTLTMEVFNEAGTEIAKGETYLEDLTAGKYYLKITVNKNCTGSLDVAIAV